MNLKAKQEKIIMIVAVVMAFAAAACFCRPVFYLNDDVTMRSILSGSYTGMPDGHAVYMKYPLTFVLSFLYGLTGKIHWLEIFFAGCLVWAVVEISSASKNNKKIKMMLLGILFVIPFFAYMHYTVIAAVLAGTAAFLLTREKTAAKSIVFWLLAWMIRSQAAYLALPFAAVGVLWRFFKEEKGNLKYEAAALIKLGVTALAVLFLCMGVNRLAYAGADWQAYLEYNEIRTELFDYTNFHSTDYYSENYEKYGMTEEEFLLLNSYNTMMDENIDTEKLQKVTAEVQGHMMQMRNEAEWVKECVRRYYYQLRYGDNVYVFLWLLLFGILMLFLILGRSLWGVLLMLCLGAGRSVIWIYLIYKGRFPERIVDSLYVIELLLLAGMLANLPRKCKVNLCGLKDKIIQGRKGFSTIYEGIKWIVWLAAMGVLVLQIADVIPKVREKAQVQKEWNVLKEYCESDPETLYLLDVFSAVEYGGLQYETDCGNLMLAGGWMSDSPLANERFENRGVVDGGQALYEDVQTVFLMDQSKTIEEMERYMSVRYGDCRLQQVDEIMCSEDKVFGKYRIIKP